jgi:hypothetical protein
VYNKGVTKSTSMYMDLLYIMLAPRCRGRTPASAPGTSVPRQLLALRCALPRPSSCIAHQVQNSRVVRNEVAYIRHACGILPKALLHQVLPHSLPALRNLGLATVLAQ